MGDFSPTPTTGDMMMDAAKGLEEISFTYDVTTIGDLSVTHAIDEDTQKEVIESVVVKGEQLIPTGRFWNSLFSTFGFNSAIFKYYSHAEVFERISQRGKSDRMRVCVERNKNGTARLLGVSNPTRPLIGFSDLMENLKVHHANGAQYSEGIVESFHTPRNGSGSLTIVGDTFRNQFVVATPIDGYGQPNVYLSMLRQVCSNGLIAYAKAFRSSVNLGKANDNVQFSLTRVLDQFGNEEGYAALRERLESAAMSWASVYETAQLYKLLVKLIADIEGNTAALASTPSLGGHLKSGVVLDRDGEEIGSPILRAFHAMTGDTSQLYGLANLDSLSMKRQRTLPVKCTLYDAINFATEVATHHSEVGASRQLQAWVGNLISTEYDMERTKERYADFADFHIQSKLSNQLTGSTAA